MSYMDHGGYHQQEEDLYSFGDDGMEDDMMQGNAFFGGNPFSNYGFNSTETLMNDFGESNMAPGTRGGPTRPLVSGNPWGGVPGTASRGAFGTASAVGAGEEVQQRPMTSINAAGFSSKKKDPLSENFVGGRGRAPALQKKSEISDEDAAAEMELGVHRSVEESALLCQNKDFALALDKAKEAEKREKALLRFREEKQINQEQNVELSYVVQFNLARVYQLNGMYTESLETYEAIVRNKATFEHAGRLRVNMGNIYFEKGDYPLAIKMYRMALDQITNDYKTIRNKIRKNIGVSLIKLGQYSDAISNFEEVIENNNNDIDAAFNLVVCHFSTGNKKEMRKAFLRLLNVNIPGLPADEDLDDEHNSLINDALRDYLKDHQRKQFDFILKSAKLIAELIEDDWEKGYDFVIEQLKSYELKREKCNIVSEVEMTKALTYMKHKQFSKAIEALKSFEKKDRKLQARSATNLSFLYLLEGDMKNAEKYASTAVESDKYNANALVNRGNCHYLNKELREAKEYYQRALECESDCVQAIYNLGIVTRDLREYEESLACFRKVHSMIPENIEVIYQLASVHSKMGDNITAIEWFNVLITLVPTDPGVLYDLGTIYAKENDESQSFNYYLESYKNYPINLDVISWLGFYFVKNDIYEKALAYFERASEIQPNKSDWQLMVASCHRRIGNLQQAKKCYERIHNKDPENYECVQYLEQICRDLNLRKEERMYAEKKAKLKNRMKEKQEEQERLKEESKENTKEEHDKLHQELKNHEKTIDMVIAANKSPTAKSKPQPTFDIENDTNVNDRKIENEDDMLNVDADDYIDSLYN
ncbi:hypothetical protein NAEGRDRAFT_63280 [Naegleria gruberi]|uniref:Uncharacterized protein n=1 Tax=Naegleria gruberi TaxID=5762 RepID=D2V399_NAEGR|nr:uncharacterized protein NAEGRDRAFT_63280 [Naegleria gruberi]EFC48600.1 hypothetical protein NAEGRDRAFT_63280 [Naegleria gruberi]|eukprot:XP_002681344.1 hypothetical protein NAEGRDRAFT_63280 [Naegleria gruberi strain NEG-M]